MATLKSIWTKIKTTKNIAKITNALEVVATIKLQKIKKETDAFKKYVIQLLHIAADIFHQIPQQVNNKSHDKNKNLHIVIGSDKGLCGAINSKIYKDTIHYIKTHSVDTTINEIITIGKKVKIFFDKTHYKNIEHITISDTISKDEIDVLHSLIETVVHEEHYNNIFIHFTYFKNTLKQIPTTLCLYPFQKKDFEDFIQSIDLSINDFTPAKNDFTFEPSTEHIKSTITQIFIDIMIHWAILHHKTSEFAARMLAMKSSKDNAKQIIDNLTIQYNKIRQDTITKEIIEIVWAKAIVDA